MFAGRRVTLSLRRFLSQKKGDIPPIPKSEAHSQSATEVLRNARKEAIKESTSVPQQSKVVGPQESPKAVGPQESLINKKTGEPLYEMQEVNSAAHIYKQKRKAGEIPNPYTKETPPKQAHQTMKTSEPIRTPEPNVHPLDQKIPSDYSPYMLEVFEYFDKDMRQNKIPLPLKYLLVVITLAVSFVVYDRKREDRYPRFPLPPALLRDHPEVLKHQEEMIRKQQEEKRQKELQ